MSSNPESYSSILLRLPGTQADEKSIPLEIPGRYLIGTEAAAIIRVASEADLSPRHAILLLDPTALRIRDLDSHSGTFLNGAKIETAELTDGDCIRCGSLSMYVKVLTGGPRTQMVNPMASSVESVEVGTKLPVITGYSDLILIGRGSLGTVYQARQLGTNRKVAIKCIRPEFESDERTRQLFIREASITAQLNHPRIVKFLGFGLTENRPFLVMEYFDTENLEHVVWKHDPARVRLAVKIVIQTLDALVYAHAASIVHRDVKPSNILASTAGGRLHLKISDFGLAKIFHTAGYSGITASNEICGTLAYMSPEQLMNSRHAKPESDVYSVVVCLYRLLTGEYPHPEGTPVEMIHRRLNDSARPVQSINPEVPDELAQIIDLGLSRSPELRLSSALALRTALEALPLLRPK